MRFNYYSLVKKLSLSLSALLSHLNAYSVGLKYLNVT